MTEADRADYSRAKLDHDLFVSITRPIASSSRPNMQDFELKIDTKVAPLIEFDEIGHPCRTAIQSRPS